MWKNPGLALFGCAWLGVVQCARPEPTQVPKNPPAASAAAAPSASSSAAPSRIAAIEASILFTDCSKAPIATTPRLKETVDQLVKNCESVPTGNARFQATLEPGGRITLAPPEGQDGGVVPLCVVGQGLRHQLLVVKPCRMEVELEQRGTAK